ncbi:MAG: flagellar biosynthesis protein FlhB [Oscillospiraceae bacterium]|jgi:flagellar biosynthetic protein FlhB|nr:flagellar biosynthesis protein FlhB [Oscillospiraceae bacterium]
MTPDQGGGGEKTEKATPKKREDARKKGQVLKSAEVNTAVLTTVMFVIIFAAGGWMVRGMGRLLEYFITRTGVMRGDPVKADIVADVTKAIWQFLWILLPVLLVAIAMGVAVNVAQVGFLFTAETVRPKLSKISILQGFKRIFSMRSVVEMLKSVLKITLMTVIVYQEYRKNLNAFPMMMGLPAGQAAGVVVDMAIAIAIKASAVLIAIGLADYLYQWWEYERNLKMSREEIKQEIKQMEGDPLIRSRRREKQRQMSMMRMMRAIPQADVVITNPTHYSVAIRYNEKEADAPVVLAKGKDHIAFKIREIAEQNRVEIVENKPVAQALYVSCEIGQRIPPDMFAAVAEILSYVYKKRHPRQGPGHPAGGVRPVRRSAPPPRRAGNAPQA